MASKEIVTIQSGHYSNFIGTHWWNLQEAAFVYSENQTTDIDNDIFFREGKTQRGEETYLPRAVIVDLKGSLNTLRHESDLYKESQNSPITWDGEVSTHKEEPAEKNEFLRDIEDDEKDAVACNSDTGEAQKSSPEATRRIYDLDDEVKVWSDFLRTRFHPRSLYIIEEHNHTTPDSFGLFDAGAELWACRNVSEQVEDKIRYFTEECDYLQGFHLLVDGDNAFSAIGSGIGAHLQEEYSKKDVIAFPSFPVKVSDDRKAVTQCLYNTAFVLERLSSLDLTVPLSLASSFGFRNANARQFKYVSYNPLLNYHTSAILACGLDALTLPYRLRRNPTSLQDVVASTTSSNMKIAAASVGFPFSTHANIADAVEELHNTSFTLNSLTSELTALDKDIRYQMFGFRGYSQPEYSSLANTQLAKPEDLGRTAQETVAHYIGKQNANTMSSVNIARDYCNTIAPFPNIFAPEISRDGRILDESRTDSYGVEKVPVLGGIHCTLKIRAVLEGLCADVAKLKANKLFYFSQSEELEAVTENLQSLAACYSYYGE